MTRTSSAATLQPLDLGRLSEVGIKAPWQVPLLLPTRWDTLSLATDLSPGAVAALDGPVCVTVTVTGHAQANQDRPPKTIFPFETQDGCPGRATIWGRPTSEFLSLRKGQQVTVWAKADYWRDQLQIAIKEQINPGWIGRLRPTYPGKPGRIAAPTVRSRILGLLDVTIPLAACVLRDRLKTAGREIALLRRAWPATTDLSPPDIETLLWWAHLPRTVEEGESAATALRRLASVDALIQSQLQSAHRPAAKPITASPMVRESMIPFALTDEQRRAVTDILGDLARPVAMNRLLTGDVGTGKTAVYGLAAMAAVDAGARVAILMPNVALASQVIDEFRAWWPDCGAVLVTGGRAPRDLAQASLVIGTTALLKRDLGARDFLIIDEQQKFSLSQREQIGICHRLEVSATCIPRTQALVEMGLADVSMLSRGHVKKHIETRLWGPEDRRSLFETVQATVAAGHQIAIVYPLRGDKGPDDAATVRSAAQAFQHWECLFPGRVRAVHGGLSDADKRACIEDMRADRADVLITTTLIEVGLTLPRLRRMLVVDAKRYGLTTLHQLRGRLARTGGQGWFDLYLSDDEVAADTQERLACLTKTQDGFALAEMDLTLRGMGTLEGDLQSGAGQGFLVGRRIDYADIAFMADFLGKPSPIQVSSS